MREIIVLKVDLIVVAIETPLLIGIYNYKDGKLLEELKFDGQTSEILPIEFDKLLQTFKIERVLFANGPGSFMAIKINYIFLRTISIIKEIELFGIDAFFFNENSPIRAINSMFFVKKDGEISLQKIDDFERKSFQLPKFFEVEKYHKNIEPLYILPAI